MAHFSPRRLVGQTTLWAMLFLGLSSIATAEPPAPQKDGDESSQKSGADAAPKEGVEGQGTPAQKPTAEPTPAGGVMPGNTSSGPDNALKAALDASVVKGDLAAITFLCGLAFDRADQKASSLPAGVGDACAGVFLRVGDKRAMEGHAIKAHDAWSRAALFKPALNEDFLYLSRLKAHPMPEPVTVVPEVTGKVGAPIAVPRKRIRKRPKVVEPLGPRGGKIFGLGLGGGFDGLASVVASFLYRERLAVEVSVGLLFPTIDTRVRYFGMKSALTPVVGFGMTTPLSGDARFELEVPGYTALYRLGQTVHVDVGLSWFVWEMDLFAGMVFITSLDQEHLDRLLFFPQFGLQAQFLF